jgi:ribosomal protein S18 acetylase RimI-like enzyme
MNRKTENIDIIEVKKASLKILTSLQHIFPQSIANLKTLDMSDLQDTIDSQNTLLFIAIDRLSGDQIIGTYTLVVFRIITGMTIRIEDVIVDGNRRGEGIGRKMMLQAINDAKSYGASKIELTSHSSRIVANNLYQSLDFKKIETNVYRLEL